MRLQASKAVFTNNKLHTYRSNEHALRRRNRQHALQLSGAGGFCMRAGRGQLALLLQVGASSAALPTPTAQARKPGRQAVIMNTVNTREAVYSFKRTSRAKLCTLSKEHQNHMQLLLEATSSRQQQATTGDPLFDSIVPSSQRRSTEIEPATADTHAMEIVLQDRKHNTKSLSTTSMQLLLQCCYGPRVLGATCN